MSLSLTVLDHPQGVVLYHGRSKINGKTIVVILTGLGRKTQNEKTGDMLQTWILVDGKKPFVANRDGDDEAVCGQCKHRHFRSCYVNLIHGPDHVYKAFLNGSYPRVDASRLRALVAGRMVRFGAYGDPAAAPTYVWKRLAAYAAGWTGYTHQWKTCDAELRNYCMASCDTFEEAWSAAERGWRPFYVRQEGEPLPEGFFSCPASKEAGKVRTCATCRVCKGGEHVPGKGLPSIVAHGTEWKRVYFHRGMRLLRQKKSIRNAGQIWAANSRNAERMRIRYERKRHEAQPEGFPA